MSSWVPTTPTPFDGELWWYGYDSWSGGYGLMAYDLASELTELRVSTYLQDPHWSPSSQLSQLSQRQPFSAGDERIVWVAWDGTQVVQEWPYGGKPDTIVSEPSRAAVRALLLDDDVPGEDVANELVDWFNTVNLTHRADLRELNELYYARFDAKLEQRLAELRSELLTAMAGLRSDLVRWMFGFWVSTLLGIAGLLIALRGQ